MVSSAQIAHNATTRRGHRGTQRAVAVSVAACFLLTACTSAVKVTPATSEAQRVDVRPKYTRTIEVVTPPEVKP